MNPAAARGDNRLALARQRSGRAEGAAELTGSASRQQGCAAAAIVAAPDLPIAYVEFEEHYCGWISSSRASACQCVCISRINCPVDSGVPEPLVARPNEIRRC